MVLEAGGDAAGGKGDVVAAGSVLRATLRMGLNAHSAELNFNAASIGRTHTLL